MIYEPTFTTEITILDECFKSIDDVQRKISNVEYEMQEIEREMSMYCCSDLKNVLPTDFEGEPIFFLKEKVKELMLQYGYLAVKLSNLELYLESNPDFTSPD